MRRGYDVILLCELDAWQRGITSNLCSFASQAEDRYRDRRLLRGTCVSCESIKLYLQFSRKVSHLVSGVS